MAAVLLLLLLQAMPSRAQVQDYRFGSAAGGAIGQVLLGPHVLSEEEHGFVARLPEVRVAVPLPSAAPYESVSASGEVSGIHPDMLVALARGFGFRIRPVVLPSWSAALAALREGQVDLMMTIGPTAERMEQFAFTLGATPRPGALFARPGAAVDPARATYVLQKEFLAVDWVRRQYPRAKIVEVPDTLSALRAVARGEGDVYLGSFLEAAATLAREPVPGVEVNRMLPYGSGYYHFAVRKDWAPLAGILNKGIQTLRDSATDELLAGAVLPVGAQLAKTLPVSAAQSALLSRRPVWRVGAVKGLALLNEIDERGLHTGIAAEYSDQLARRLGVAVQVRAFDSVSQMLDGLRAGDIDLVPLLTRTPEREREITFSAPYVEMPYVLVARNDAPLWWSLDSLRGKRLALPLQHALRPLLKERNPDITVLDAEGGTGAMDKVVRGEADAAIEVKLFANLRINQPDGERLRILAEVPEIPSQFHFAARRADADAAGLVGLVNLALADIEPAERTRMFRRWVAVDLAPPFPWRRHLPAALVGLVAVATLLGATLRWNRRLAREVKARQRSEQLLTDIATTVPGMAFRYVLNADGSLRHTYATPGAEAFLGVKPDPQRTVLEALQPFFDPAEYEAAMAQQARCMTTGETFKRTGLLKVPGRGERWILAEAIQGRTDGGRTVWTGYIVDVTAEQQLQRKLAEDAEARSLMLASASHELRAPTHTLSLALQSLPQAGLTEDQRKALRVAEDSAHTLSELLSDVLDAARAGHEPLRLRPRVFDLHQLLGDLSRAWRAAAHTKGLRFELDIAADVPRTVQLDPLRLKQVLINLLSNACKYTAQGGVTLRARMQGGGRLQLVVADTGIGIGEAEQALLFRPFATAHEATGMAVPEGSTGLGLLTSRRVAELMGATLVLDSQPGAGTRALLTLPLPAGWPAAEATQPGTVVVCDDDDTSRVLLTQMLRLNGYETHDTADSGAALQRWRQGGVRALVSDLDLPGMSGLELIRSLRSEEAAAADGSRTVVIVCSGSPVPAADGAAEQGLYDAYLVKPVQVRTLTDTLQRLGVAAG